MNAAARAWLAERDPEFAEAFESYLDAARSASALDPRTRALLLLAHDASVTVLDADGIREHAEAARAAGADEAEILGVVEVVTLISIHSLTSGLPLLYGSDEHPRPPELRGGYWDDFEARSPGFHGTLAAVLPDVHATYHRLGSVLWTRLDPRLRELALIVADLSTSHLYTRGAAMHIAGALRAGVSREEIAAAVALAVPCAARTVETAAAALSTVPEPAQIPVPAASNPAASNPAASNPAASVGAEPEPVDPTSTAGAALTDPAQPAAAPGLPFDRLDRLTLPAMLRLLATERGAEEAVVAPDGRVTWAELRNRARTMAGRYRALGLRPGERVGVLLPNSVSWLVAAFGAHLAGLVVVPVNTFYRATEYAHLVRTADLRLLVARETLFGHSVVDDLRDAGLPGRTGDRGPDERYLGLLDWPAGHTLPPGTGPSTGEADAEVAPDDVALLLFTSGSTATPKAVPLRHGNLLRNGHAIGRRQRLVPGDRLWIASPFFFGYGCANALPTALSHGVTLCMQERVDGEANLEFIERERCTVYYGLSPATHALVAAPSFGRRDISSLRTGTTGTSAEDKRLAVEMLGITEVCSVYGLTESYGHSAMTEAGDPLDVVMHTVGRVLPTQELRIVDGDGVPCPDGTPGEVELRGCVLDAYVDPPEANATSFRDGWFRTGDLGFLDAGGRMHFVGRFKEMVKIKGVNIAPAEVEDVLATHPDVVQVHVVGADDGAGGEQLVAFVVADRPLDTGVLVEHIRSRAASYKVPARFVVLDPADVPLTATGKVSRHALRERAEAH